MKEYLGIIQKEVPTVTENDLIVPIRETHIDSIDVVVIRVTLEKHFKHEVPDAVWYQFQTLSEGLDYFKNVRSVNGSQHPLSPVELQESIEIRMPQMANGALSENWLLKHLGDVHWLLLTKGLEQNSSQFKDEIGNRLYATFIRLGYSLSSLKKFHENDILDFKGSIQGFGSHTYISSVAGMSGENIIDATLMTTFSCREQSDNANLAKATPLTKTNKIPQLSQTPLFLNDYRLMRKNLLEDYSCFYGTFTFDDEEVFSCEYTINPFYEMNGVGLLYFASYPAISDKCSNEYFKEQNSIKNFCDEYYTVFRDIFYFANSSCNDTVIFRLNKVIQEENFLKTISSLYRKSDSQILARIITIKEKV
jgi:probable biosynthetic protein (TIGR04098 family)